VSNFFLDRVMPRLRDTEWRVLCVVVRQTAGWSDGEGRRKEADWLSHYQLKRRTGRSGAAISRAIDVLVRARLVIVRNSFGQELPTARSRRLSRSRLSFSIAASISTSAYQERFPHVRFTTSKPEDNKRK
jgi:hypothetical protein